MTINKNGTFFLICQVPLVGEACLDFRLGRPSWTRHARDLLEGSQCAGGRHEPWNAPFQICFLFFYFFFIAGISNPDIFEGFKKLQKTIKTSGRRGTSLRRVSTLPLVPHMKLVLGMA